MALRVAFFILMALGLVGFGTVAWIATRPPPAAAAARTVPTTREVLVAAQPIHVGQLLKPEDLTAKAISLKDPRLADSNANTPEVRRNLIGAMVRRSLAPGDVIENGDVMRPGDHGFLAAVLEPGMRAVTIAVDNTTGLAGLIWPGDRVDVILTETLNGPDLPAGRRVAAETVLADARVIAIDQQIMQGAMSRPGIPAKTVTLEVTEDQAERISVAMRLGRLSLAVRSADASKRPRQAQTRVDTTWASDVSPALQATRPPPAPDSIVRVFQGGGQVREFRY